MGPPSLTHTNRRVYTPIHTLIILNNVILKSLSRISVRILNEDINSGRQFDYQR